MNQWNQVYEVELVERHYGKAEIVLRRKDGTAIDVLPVKWNQRREALRKITNQWLKETHNDSK